MGHKVKQSLMSNRVDFFYYAFRNVLLVSVPILIISILILSLPRSSARRVSSSDNFTVSILSSCTLSSKVNEEHSVNVVDGTYNADIGRTTLTTFCNDRNGYVVYAVGDSNNEIGNNKLISNINSNYDIVSNTNTTGNASSWAMKLSSLNTNIGDIDNPGYITNSNNNTVATNQGTDTPTIDPLYNDTYGTVPATWAKVAYKPSGTVNSTSGSSFSTTYAIYTSPTQPAGTYVGQVKYLLTHPSSAAPTDLYIMQNVAEWEDEIPNEGDSVMATDIRDNKGYYVTRLTDGHIWMTQNLDLDIEANTVLNSNTTDLNVAYDSSTGQYAEYSDGYTKDNGVIYWKPASSANTIDFTGTTVTGWQNGYTTPYTANKTDSTETGHASLGNYYNWTAAIASNDSSSLTTSTFKDATKNPQNSICPKGWRLPIISSESETLSGSTNEFARLNYLYNNNRTSGDNADAGLIAKPLWLVRGGIISRSLNLYEYSGHYWSSTIHNSNNAYYLTFNTNNINPTGNGNWDYLRYGGRSVRCVAK